MSGIDKFLPADDKVAVEAILDRQIDSAPIIDVVVKFMTELDESYKAWLAAIPSEPAISTKAGADALAAKAGTTTPLLKHVREQGLQRDDDIDSFKDTLGTIVDLQIHTYIAETGAAITLRGLAPLIQRALQDDAISRTQRQYVEATLPATIRAYVFQATRDYVEENLGMPLSPVSKGKYPDLIQAATQKRKAYVRACMTHVTGELE